MKKNVLILVAAMLLSVANGWAQSGTFGANNLTWVLSDSTLTISGSGAMNNYNPSSSPWYSYRSSIRTVIIGNGVTTIGSSAFYYCPNLASVTIPNSVTTIGNSAFSVCQRLTAVTIPNSVTAIGLEAFAGCSGLTAVTIPNSVTTIGNMAFAACHGLTAVTIPNSVTTIGNMAFAACLDLTSIDVADNNTNYSSENGILFNKSKTTLIQYPAGRKEATYTIPNGVTTIEEATFAGCWALTAVTIPNSVTTIRENAFVDSGLTSISVAENNTHYLSENGILFNKSKTTLVQYPAFRTGTTYSIPNSVTTIGACAFYFCELLTAVTIPNSITTIGVSAFEGCTRLTAVTIPNSVTTIGASAFYLCSGLTAVTIPNSVTRIGNSAFNNCRILTEVTVEWTRPLAMTNEVLFANVNLSAATLRVPNGTKALYQAANVWKDFGTIVEYNLTDNENIHTPTLKAYASNGILHISGLQPDKPLHIYSLSGQLVYKGIAKAEQESIPVAARGIYIITAGEQTVKAINN